MGGKVNKTWFKDKFTLSTIRWHKAQIIVPKQLFSSKSYSLSFLKLLNKERKSGLGGNKRYTGIINSFKLFLRQLVTILKKSNLCQQRQIKKCENLKPLHFLPQIRLWCQREGWPVCQYWERLENIFRKWHGGLVWKGRCRGQFHTHTSLQRRHWCAPYLLKQERHLQQY